MDFNSPVPKEWTEWTNDFDTELLVWYIIMIVVCVAFNLTMLYKCWGKVQPVDSYTTTMKYLAVPWVLECAWRSVFPSLYLQRFVFWDTPLNAIIVDRTWALFGELSWVFQTMTALRYVDLQITGGKSWVQASGWVAFAIYVLAEMASYYNTATTNEKWAAIEVALDGISYVCMAPASIYLLCKLPADQGWDSSAKIYLAVMIPMTIAYPLYNFLIDCPMYMERYAEDEAAGKVYFDFLPGLYDAAVTRNPTHHLEDWQADMFWMSAYFSVGAWSGMLMMFAPQLKTIKVGDGSYQVQLLTSAKSHVNDQGITLV
uniref:Uncharacterized protein n=1 Tax=Florenciella parvula TaxID=236787 RepID=A0A7S2C3D1_9STRA|mmetsp:Transcript_23804/g.49258  ORF Transcript_23804/g.49258 Transcript_23804/m.49258 type:complete len:315 (+) Transcript_23804:114-1058(+)|eukprot:CAMPEP_0182544522 /NCGR_PEP_ID=MMETSP1323-20130603/33253_1 /TAXON_ID=236787 /ORGANISM="Florenciella parvula, Strain RCC1693" /LENGTH=314 /DNA_ID=CAMNT_0024755573 /DNA_START=105 /DNA_END=1049 /DNA_ORIENTATION=+